MKPVSEPTKKEDECPSCGFRYNGVLRWHNMNGECELMNNTKIQPLLDKVNPTPQTQKAHLKDNHFPCECACHDPSYKYETIPCESCTSPTPLTKEQQLEKAEKYIRQNAVYYGNNQFRLSMVDWLYFIEGCINEIEAQAIK